MYVLYYKRVQTAPPQNSAECLHRGLLGVLRLSAIHSLSREKTRGCVVRLGLVQLPKSLNRTLDWKRHQYL